ncbi:MAG: hypothetical protein K9G30_03865 [Parvibaculum sp.]|nr:hypothetical protein [Parvibaculum sp.]
MGTKIIRGSAWCDLAITLPFALPFVAGVVITLLQEADRWLGLGTSAMTFVTGPLTMMFIHIMGVLGVVWAIARLCLPVPLLSRMDAIARIVVTALILHAMTEGATPLLWFFIATEVLGSAAQFFALRQTGMKSPG